MIITIEYCRHSWREKRENTTTTRTWKPSHEWRKRLTRSRHECDSLTRTFVLLVRVHTFSMISPDRYTLLKTAVLCAGSCRVRFSDFVSSEFFKMLTFFAMWFWKKTFICIGEIYVFLICLLSLFKTMELNYWICMIKVIMNTSTVSIAL